MKFCFKCGQLLNDCDVYCSRCGQKQPLPYTHGDGSATENSEIPHADNPPAATCGMPDKALSSARISSPAYACCDNTAQHAYGAVLPEMPKSLSATPYFIWSLIIIFILNPIGTPLAIISTFFAAYANWGSNFKEKAEKNIDISRTLCIIATCVDVLSFIILIISGILYSQGGTGTLIY